MTTKFKTRVRLASYVLVVGALLLAAVGASSVAKGLGTEAGRPFLVAYFVDDASLFALGIAGLAVANGSRRIVAYLAGILAVAVATLLLRLVGPVGTFETLTQGAGDVAYAVIGLSGVVAFWSALELRSKAASEDEPETVAPPATKPDYVPESMVQSGAAPFAPTGRRAPSRGSSAPLLLLFNASQATASGDGATVTDAHGNVIFRVLEATSDRPAHVDDAAGNQVAAVSEGVVSGQGAYEVEMFSGSTFSLPLNLAGAGNEAEVAGLGWKLKGEGEEGIAGFDLDVTDAEGHVIARARPQLTSEPGTRGAAIYERSHADELAVILAVARGLVG